MYANEIANSICSQLVRETEPLPKELQQVCEALVESKEMHGNQPVTIESNIGTEETTFRVRAQWLKVEASQHPCILLRLQNQDQAVHGLAIAEAQKWNLTPRETEVWSLRRAGFKRKEIAAELYIAEDTVKKHLKNIQFKRQAALDEEEWRSNQAS
jgi:DNA-binding CsgD family transcriptional regulator